MSLAETEPVSAKLHKDGLTNMATLQIRPVQGALPRFPFSHPPGSRRSRESPRPRFRQMRFIA